MKKITVSQSVELAIRHPQTASSLLAKTFADFLKLQPWMDKGIITRFFIMFMNNLFDRSIELSVDPVLYEKVRAMPFQVGFRLLERKPEDGLRVLVKIVMEELRDKQNLPLDEQIGFFNQLFEHMFPDIDFSTIEVKQ